MQVIFLLHYAKLLKTNPEKGLDATFDYLITMYKTYESKNLPTSFWKS